MRHLVLLTLILSGFVFAAPVNMAYSKAQLENYYDSGNYYTQVNAVVQKAKAQLKRAVASKGTNKLAIVIDIDETALSNYNQISALYSAVGNVGDLPNPNMLKTINNPFVDQAIRPVLSLYKEAVADDVTVFFLTGRYEYDRAGTERNLKNVGYTKWKQLILRKPAQYHIPASVYKTAARKKIEANGYDVAINIGDQYSDLRGGYSDSTYKIPNPFYYIP
jgi:predicted secreted acid phosphatase